MTSPADSAQRTAETLLSLARSSLREAVGLEAPVVERPDWLADEGACFVTLRVGQHLRGCLGSVRPYRSLADDLIGNTRAAALRDPRFPPVGPEELDEIEIEISVLSPLEPLSVESEAELLEILRPGVDGLILEHEAHRGTFLPSVWDEIGDRREFVRRLKLKAGLAVDFWSPEMSVWRYTTTSYSDADLAASPVST